MLKEASHSIGSLTIFSKQARYDYESWIQRKLNSDHPQMPGRARKLQVRLLPRSKRFSHSSLLKKWQISSCQFEKLCATNNPPSNNPRSKLQLLLLLLLLLLDLLRRRPLHGHLHLHLLLSPRLLDQLRSEPLHDAIGRSLRDLQRVLERLSLGEVLQHGMIGDIEPNLLANSNRTLLGAPRNEPR